MSSASPESVDHWLELKCPRCKGTFRIKSAYAHMSGRCPHCGRFIEAPRPISASKPANFESDEPHGLVPIEEEWPEPAQMEVDDRRHYEFGAPPAQWSEPKIEKSPEVEGYGFEGGPSAQAPPPRSVAEMYSAPFSREVPKIEPTLSPAPAAPLEESYQVNLPLDTPPRPPAVPVEEEKKGPERIPSPPPLPPARPLWQGVYTFPWRVENLKVWIALGLALSLFAFLAAIFYQLIFVEKILETEGLNLRAAFTVVIIPPMAVLSLVAALYGSAHFLAILEDTAGGNDAYQKPEIVTTWFGCFFHLAYIGFWTFVPSGAIAAGAATASASPWGLLAGLPPALILFPTFLLSSMSGASSLTFLQWSVVLNFLRKPLLLPILFVVSSVLAAVVLSLGYVTGTTSNFFLAFVTGLGWSACLIIYARLLGRVAWVMSQSGVQVRKRRKKRRKKTDLGPDDWGAGTETPEVEKSI